MIKEVHRDHPYSKQEATSATEETKSKGEGGTVSSQQAPVKENSSVPSAQGQGVADKVTTPPMPSPNSSLPAIRDPIPIAVSKREITLAEAVENKPQKKDEEEEEDVKEIEEKADHATQSALLMSPLSGGAMTVVVENREGVGTKEEAQQPPKKETGGAEERTATSSTEKMVAKELQGRPSNSTALKNTPPVSERGEEEEEELVHEEEGQKEASMETSNKDLDVAGEMEKEEITREVRKGEKAARMLLVTPFFICRRNLSLTQPEPLKLM